MSNHTGRPAPAPAPQPAPSTDRPTDRPTATYPTADHLAHLEHEEAAHRERLADLWADRTPTEELPLIDAASTAHGGAGAGTHACRTPAHPSTDRESILDMWRPRRLPAWHPSLMQLAIGAALVAALLGACNVAAINAHRTARAYCHALVVSDWDRAQRECRPAGSGTPVPEQVPTAPAQSEQVPADAPSQPAEQAPSTQAPSTKPVWTVHGTDSPYDRTDPLASPLDLPHCTTAQDTPMPCLAHISNDSRHVTVLEEDASLTGLDRR